MLVALALAAALPGPLPSAYNGPCSTPRAHYVLRHDAKVTIEFGRYRQRPEDMTSDIYMVYRSRQTGHVYWYGMDFGSDDIIKLYPISDPEKKSFDPEKPDRDVISTENMTIWGADAGLNIADGWEEANGQAPKYIFIPELEDAMRHNPPEPEALPRAFFILESCRKR